jgi:hypothetical protein
VKPSKYLERFQRLADSLRDQFQLTGDYVIVERIPDSDFTKSVKREDGTEAKLIISTDYATRQHNSIAADKPNWLRVLLVGEGYYDTATDSETGETIESTIPLDVVPGDIVMVSQVAVKYFSMFGELEGYEADSIGITKASDIQLRFKGLTSYEQCFNKLNNKNDSK